MSTPANNEDTSHTTATSADFKASKLSSQATTDNEISDEDDLGTIPSVGCAVEEDVAGEEGRSTPQAPLPMADELQFSVKALLDFLARNDSQQLWSYEDITPKQLTIRSAQQLAIFVRNVVAVSDFVNVLFRKCVISCYFVNVLFRQCVISSMCYSSMCYFVNVLF